MARVSNFTDPFAEVRMEKVQVAGQEVEKLGVLIKNDDGDEKCVGILSKDYNLITNQTAHDVAHDVMSHSPYNWKDLKTFWNGHQYISHYITDTAIHNEGGIPLHAGIMVRNAYDGSGCFGFEMFACNMVCTNQYISRNRFGFFAIRHSGKGFDIQDAIENVERGAQNLLEIAPRIHALRETELSIPAIVKAKQSVNIPQSKWGDVVDQLGHEEGTLFGLFQALTFVATHKLSGYTAIGIGDTITNYMLD